MNKEYEYCFKVKDLKELIKFLENNNYKLVEKYNQTRTIYKNNSKVMARITSNEYDNKIDKILDFKDDSISDSSLNIRRESSPLIVSDENKDFVESLLDILNYKEKTILNRNRSVYVKEDVIFEIDDYKDGNDIVVSIEGEKEIVDKTYNKVIKLIKNEVR